MIFRPIRVDDLVTVAGHTGFVEEIAVFTTTLRTPANQTIILPNGQVTSASIVNLTVKGTLRLDLVVGVAYGDDLNRAQATLEQVLASDPRVLSEPAPLVAVSELGESSVNFVVRPWVKVEDYWPLRFDTIKRVKEALDAARLTIPFPQRDIHVHQVASLPKARASGPPAPGGTGP
jgi:small conductance mechanosensitive channel